MMLTYYWQSRTTHRHENIASPHAQMMLHNLVCVITMTYHDHHHTMFVQLLTLIHVILMIIIVTDYCYRISTLVTLLLVHL